MQDCSNSTANVHELRQSSTKPSTYAKEIKKETCPLKLSLCLLMTYHTCTHNHDVAWLKFTYDRDHFVCVPSQWETTLQCNVVSHWLDAFTTLPWRHNGPNSISNHQPYDCLLNHVFRRRSKKTSKLRVTGLCAGNSPGTGEFPAQMASNAENVSIWWRHHETIPDMGLALPGKMASFLALRLSFIDTS